MLVLSARLRNSVRPVHDAKQSYWPIRRAPEVPELVRLGPVALDPDRCTASEQQSSLFAEALTCGCADQPT